jgi:glycosyltransferase involved in cell wall biosynthesis
MDSTRLLFLGGGPLMPTSQSADTLKHSYLSDYFSGDIITTIMHPKHKNIKSIGNFRYNPFVASGNILIRSIKTIITYIFKSLELYRINGKYDVIIASNPLLTGMIALVIGKIKGTMVVIEVNGNFESAFRYVEKGEKILPILNFIKEIISKSTIPWVLRRADMVKLLSDNQLMPFNIDCRKMRTSIFSDFVPVKKFIECAKSDQEYILLLGYPWYLKGVDILIKAFNIICNEFPEYKLKVVGWCPEGRDYYESLKKRNHRIELCEPVYYQDVIPIMANCSLYVLASRTEAMGRVLIEAMACRKPIIASNVGGVSSIIKDGYNGLLFEKENVYDLADKMRYLLSNPEEAKRLGVNGFKYVLENLSEECYKNNYRKMIYNTLIE